MKAQTSSHREPLSMLTMTLTCLQDQTPKALPPPNTHTHIWSGRFLRFHAALFSSNSSQLPPQVWVEVPPVYRTLVRGPQATAKEDAGVLRDYFNLEVSLTSMNEYWSQRDERFKAVHPCIPGARVLRQDPVECLFEFICSSNNNISRIQV